MTGLGSGLYQIHPALPGYLATRWREEEPHQYDQAAASAEHALAYTYASWGLYMDMQIKAGDASVSLEVIGLKRRTLLTFLGKAIDGAWWDCAYGLAKPLWEYWRSVGVDNEAELWAVRLRDAAERSLLSAPPLAEPTGRQFLRSLVAQLRFTTAGSETLVLPLGSPEGHLWLFSVDVLAEVELLRRRLHLARRHSRRMALGVNLDYTLGPELQAFYLAAIYFRLGKIWQEAGRLRVARRWYRRSLALGRKLALYPIMAATFIGLGTTAKLRKRFSAAERWYRRASALNQELGDEQSLLVTSHQSANLALERGQLNVADQRFRDVLALARELNDIRAISNSLHQLGIVAQEQGRIAVAREWFHQALAISEQLGDRPGIARTYSQLAMLSDMQGKPQEALAWMVRAATQLERFPHPALPNLDHNLSILVGRLGMPALERCWQDITGNPLPREIHTLARPAVAGAKVRKFLRITAPADRQVPLPRSE